MANVPSRDVADRLVMYFFNEFDMAASTPRIPSLLKLSSNTAAQAF